MKNSFIYDLLHIFYPKLCVNCETHLLTNEQVLCTICRHDLPLINYSDYTNNKIAKIFYGRVNIEKANALLFFRKKGITKQLIHDLKYKGNQDVGVFFGKWWADLLSENKEFNKIDYIIPVPLHPKKQKTRGYNQVTKFGEILSTQLNIAFSRDVLIRVSSSKTQTFKARFERFNNLDTKFMLTDISIYNNKHVLLIDDVITTGATLEACAKELHKTKNIKISVLTMAYTE